MFSCFDTIPACDGQPASHVAVASTRYAYLRRAVMKLVVIVVVFVVVVSLFPQISVSFGGVD